MMVGSGGAAEQVGVGFDAGDESAQVVNGEFGVVDAEEQGEVAAVAVALHRRRPDLDRGRLSPPAITA